MGAGHREVTELVLADATQSDRPPLFEIFADVVAQGDGYPDDEPAIVYWRDV